MIMIIRDSVYFPDSTYVTSLMEYTRGGIHASPPPSPPTYFILLILNETKLYERKEIIVDA